MVQQFRKSITALAFFLISGLAWGQPSQGPLAIKPDAPDRYVVVRGDTLWGISQRYTDSPWRWPELWSMNKEQIRNPHLIYPGYVIILDRERARLSIAGGESGTPAVTSGTPAVTTGGAESAPVTTSGTVKLSPRVRTESLAKQEIPSIPAGVIEPFLTRPLVIEPDGLEKAPTIIGTQGDRVILAEGSAAYVRGIGQSSEDTWYVYRKGGPLIDPDTNKTLAYEAIYLGTARLTRPGEPATVVLSSAVQEVGAGDKLVAAGRAMPPNYAPHAPAVSLSGRVMTIYGGLGGVGEAGDHAVVTINRGKADGIEIGHVLALYSAGGTARDVTKTRNAPDANIKLPDERSGLVFVFRVFDRVSYALVMNITRPVNTLDVVQTP
jgi:nucleoid-associated protein YgaU